MGVRFLKKVSERVEPPGLEWKLLKLMPRAMLFGTLVPALLSLGARLLIRDGHPADIAKQVLSVDIFSIALLITAWTAILTVSIGCIVVFIMKGPAYEADSYSIPHNKRNRL
ncbi:MAG: hypothetical protein QNJ00_06045 [Woeseiaceae bacterium]|nr:hypothetical protein [Woeseiaceae bacterium]